MLDYLEFQPAFSKKAIIIWLHGLGADYHDFYSLAEILQLPDFPIHFIFPNAPIRPVTINGHFPMRAWYDISSPNLGNDVDHAGISQSLSEIQSLIEAQQKENLHTPILLAGFSQGAVIAMMTALTASESIQGVIALSGYLPQDHFEPTQHPLPCFVSHGIRDAIVPFKAGEHAMQTLKQLHHSVTWHHNRREHTVDAETLEEIKKWLFCFSNSLDGNQLTTRVNS